MSSILMQDQVDLGDRKLYIGGSDIGAIMGVNPHRSPVQVYYDKVEGSSFKGNEATRWGNILEAVVAAEYAREKGVKVVRDRRTFRHPEHDYMLGHIDRRILNFPDGKGLEVKTAGKWFKPADWEEAPPMSYQYQCHWYMMLTTWRLWDLVALLAGQDYRVYSIEFDEWLQREMVDAAIEFMARVRERNPPAPVNEDDCKRIWAYDNGETAIAGREEEEMAKELAFVKARIEEYEAIESRLKTQLLEFMAPRSYLVDIAGNKLASWKNNQELDVARIRADYPELVAPFLVEKMDTAAFKKANAKLAKDYQKQSDTRVFRLSVKE